MFEKSKIFQTASFVFLAVARNFAYAKPQNIMKGEKLPLEAL